MARKGGAPENLSPIKKGEVRNPTGKNGWSSWHGALSKVKNEDDMTMILRKVYDLALDGDMDACKFILEKTYPKIDKPIELDVKIDDARQYILSKLGAGG